MSVWFQINRKMVNTIWFLRFHLIRFRKYIFLDTHWVWRGAGPDIRTCRCPLIDLSLLIIFFYVYWLIKWFNKIWKTFPWVLPTEFGGGQVFALVHAVILRKGADVVLVYLRQVVVRRDGPRGGGALVTVIFIQFIILLNNKLLFI